MGKSLGREIWIVAAKRTPFGTFGGALKEQSATDLAVVAAKAALAQAKLDPALVEDIFFGNVMQTSADALYLARHVGLRAGAPVATPALTVNRLCGSGFQAIVNGAEQLLLGESELVLVGGSESMSQAPHVIRGARWGLPFGKEQKLGDTLWDALTDSYTNMPMAITAENLAEEYGIDRAACDAYALRSQKAWAEANEAGRFKEELCPVELPSRKGPTQFAVDEHPRRETALEGLAKLPPVFKKDGVVTAGNASGICDGAAALLLCTKEAGQKHGLRPLARLTQWAYTGCDPKKMGIGPVPAVRRALERAGRRLDEVDLFEVNEAFAPQYLAVEKALELPRDRTNVDGGAIALGHPLGASGARITTHLVYALAARGKKVAVGSACIGGGQGIAVVVEAA